MDMNAMPVIHMGGTSRDTLVDQRLDAANAIGAALAAMEAMSPNRRDYHMVQGRWEVAVTQYQARVRVLEELRHAIIEEVSILTGE